MNLSPDDQASIVRARRTVLAMERLKSNPDFGLFRDFIGGKIDQATTTALESKEPEKREEARLDRLALITARDLPDAMINGAKSVLANYPLSPEDEATLDAL